MGVFFGEGCVLEDKFTGCPCTGYCGADLCWVWSGLCVGGPSWPCSGLIPGLDNSSITTLHGHRKSLHVELKLAAPSHTSAASQAPSGKPCF